MALAFCLAVALWQQGLPARAADWQAPLEAPLTLVHPFYLPNGDYSAGHRGVDYQVADGQLILAATAGRVWFVGKVVDRQVLSIKTPSGDLLEFEPVCSDLTKGDQVSIGQPVATVCEADPSYRQHCQVTCLHYSLRTALGYLSPLVRTEQLAPSVLLSRTGFDF